MPTSTHRRIFAETSVAVQRRVSRADTHSDALPNETEAQMCACCCGRGLATGGSPGVHESAHVGLRAVTYAFTRIMLWRANRRRGATAG